MTTDEIIPERNLDGWLKQPEDYRDYLVASYRPDILALAAPASFDLRGANMPPIQDQGALGSCVAWACVRAYRYVQRKQGLQDLDFSELATYYWARAYQGWTQEDSGAYLRDGIKALVEHGAPEEATWPYVISLYKTPPGAFAVENGQRHQATRYLAVANIQEQVKSVVASGYPVVFGIPIYSNFPQGSGVWDIPAPVGSVIGGHAMTVVGYDATGVILANSWGSSWGVQGFARMPWAYFLAQAGDLWMIETVEGVEPAPPPPPTPSTIPHYVSFVHYTKMSDGETWVSSGSYDLP